jgi:hypothetical protein
MKDTNLTNIYDSPVGKLSGTSFQYLNNNSSNNIKSKLLDKQFDFIKQSFRAHEQEKLQLKEDFIKAKSNLNVIVNKKEELILPIISNSPEM